jgi:hypothetical protein
VCSLAADGDPLMASFAVQERLKSEHIPQFWHRLSGGNNADDGDAKLLSALQVGECAGLGTRNIQLGNKGA